MENFAATDLSEQAERAMFANAKIMEEFESFTEYLLPVKRKIMRALDSRYGKPGAYLS